MYCSEELNQNIEVNIEYLKETGLVKRFMTSTIRPNETFEAEVDELLERLAKFIEEDD